MNTPRTAPTATVDAWARDLLAPALAGQPALPPSEAADVQCQHDGLMAALQAHDRAALRSARQALLCAALVQPGSPALKRSLRSMAWRMAALLPRLL